MKKYLIKLLLRLFAVPLGIIWLSSSLLIMSIWIIVILFLGEPYANDLLEWWLDLPDDYQNLIDKLKKDD